MWGGASALPPGFCPAFSGNRIRIRQSERLFYNESEVRYLTLSRRHISSACFLRPPANLDEIASLAAFFPTDFAAAIPFETLYAFRSSVKLSPDPVCPDAGSAVINSPAMEIRETVIRKKPKA
jgi:hypothetical protein